MNIVEMATEVTETEVDLAIGESEDQDHTHFLPGRLLPRGTPFFFIF